MDNLLIIKKAYFKYNGDYIYDYNDSWDTKTRVRRILTRESYNDDVSFEQIIKNIENDKELQTLLINNYKITLSLQKDKYETLAIMYKYFKVNKINVNNINEWIKKYNQDYEDMDHYNIIDNVPYKNLIEFFINNSIVPMRMFYNFIKYNKVNYEKNSYESIESLLEYYDDQLDNCNEYNKNLKDKVKLCKVIQQMYNNN